MPPSTESAPRERRLPLWPFVVLIVVLAGLAGFWKEALNSTTSRLESKDRVDLDNTFTASDKAVAFIHEVEAALAERGVGMTFVSMPYREDLYPVRNAPVEDVIPQPGYNAMVAWTALQRLRHGGTTTIDLWEEFYEAAKTGDIYEEDRCHLEQKHEDAIGVSLLEKLREVGAMDREDSQVTVIGECFAETFGEIFIIEQGLTREDILVLRGSADRGRIPNQMFRFDEIYLENCRHVVWIAPYILLRHDAFPPVVKSPKPVGGEAVELQTRLRVTKGLSMDFKTMKKAVKTMPYDDALGEIEFELADELGGAGLSAGSGILVAWAARERIRSGLEHLKEGDVIHANLYDWEAYTQERPELLREYFLEQIDDFESPRFWLSDWVKLVK